MKLIFALSNNQSEGEISLLTLRGGRAGNEKLDLGGKAGAIAIAIQVPKAEAALGNDRMEKKETGVCKGGSGGLFAFAFFFSPEVFLKVLPEAQI